MNNSIFCRGGKTCEGWGLFVLRVVTGIIFAVHGYQKLAGGIEGTGQFLTMLGVPLASFFAYVVTFVELLGGIALIAGFLTRWASLFLTIDMVVALFLVHIGNGFYISKGGYEYVLILLAASVTLLMTGAGSCALDSRCGKKEELSA